MTEPAIDRVHRTVTVSYRVAVAFVAAFVVFVVGFVMVFGWAILRINDQQDQITKQQDQITKQAAATKAEAHVRSVKNCEIQNGFSMGVRGFLIGLQQQARADQRTPTPEEISLYNRLVDSNFPVRDCPKLNEQGEAPLIPTPLIQPSS